MSSSRVPDAWDDDWVDSQASKPAEPKLTKSERRRQQYELNKKLWDEAEAPADPYYVQKTNDVPLQSGFAPQMKVLSRRPLARDAEDDDEEEAEQKAAAERAAERAEQAKKEREEKQRKYVELRQQLFSDVPRGGGHERRGRGRGANPSRGHGQLYDPKSRGSASSSGTSTPTEGPRAPRGPDGSGKGGRGFLPRGGRV